MDRHKTVEFWYRRKYSLTSTDPRFLDATVEEMLADYYAHLYHDDPKAADEVEDDEFDPDAVADLIGVGNKGMDDWEELE